MAPKAATAKSAALQLGVAQLGPAPIGDKPLPYICWAPGTSAATIAAAAKTGNLNSIGTFPASPFRTLGQGRWTRTARSGGGLVQGDPTIITYSIVPDGLIIPGGGPAGGNNATAPSNLRARFDGIYGSRAAWLAQFAQVGQALSVQTGLTFVYEPNDDGAVFGTESPGQAGVRGDIRISGRRIDGNSNVLAFNFSPDFGDMVIDTADDFFENTSRNSLGFRNVATHEFGHGLGLGHTCPIDETKLMEPTVTGAFDGPQLDDIVGLQRFYGDNLENNNTPETATALGALANGTVSRPFVSVDDAGDVDYYSLTLPANRSLTITVNPAGNSYLEGPQNDDGTCSVGAEFNPRTVNDLGFELLARDARGNFAVVRTGNANPAGQSETVSTSAFPAGGDFLVRVFGGAVNNVQIYNVDFAVGPPGTTPEPTPTPTAPPAPIRPVADLNGDNGDGTAGENSPNFNGIDLEQSIYFTAGGPQTIAPRTIVLADISNPRSAANNITEARVTIAPFPEEPTNVFQPGAPDNRDRPTGILVETLDIPQGVKDALAIRGANLTYAYDAPTRTYTIRGGVDNAFNTPDFNRGSFEIALRSVTYENKKGTQPTGFLSQPPTPGANPNRTNPDERNTDRFISYVVDTDNDASNNQDNRFVNQSGPASNPRQSKVAVANVIFGDRQSLVVTTLQDSNDPQDGANSLREAMNFANTDGVDSAITFAINNPARLSPNETGRIVLNSSLPFLRETRQPPPATAVINTSITGPTFGTATVPNARNLLIDGNGNQVFNTANNNLTIVGLSVTGSSGDGITSRNNNLSINNTSFSGNSGGGITHIIDNRTGATPVSLNVTNSNVSRNRGVGLFSSNGISNLGVKTTVINNSTFSNNQGGIVVSSGRAQSAADRAKDPTTVGLCTVAGNSSFGINSAANGSITVSNTISFDNGQQDVVGNGGQNDGFAGNGEFISGGSNIVATGNSVFRFTAAGDQVGVNPLLGPLSNNGGQSDTRRLNAGSPAINAGTATIPAPIPATDQRGTGFVRAFGVVDIGAYEVQEAPERNSSFTVVISPREPGKNTTLTATATGTEQNGTAIQDLYYRWFINGREVLVGVNANRLNLSNYTFPDFSDVTVIVARNRAEAENVLSPQATDSVVVRVTNEAPSVTSVTLAPNALLTNDRLTATARVNDPENDPFNVTYRWTVNGNQVRSVTKESGVPGQLNDVLDLSLPGNGDRGDVVQVTVTATQVDSQVASAPRSASVTVGNSAPSARDVQFQATAGQQAQVLLAGSDPDGDPLVFSIVTAPTKGTAFIEVNSDGRYILYYTPNADATGTDTIVFRATDNNTAPNGQPSNARNSENATATVAIVGGGGTNPTPTPEPNRAPSALSTSVNAKREVPIVQPLGAADPDETDPYSTLRFLRVSGPRKGTGEIRKDTDGIWKLFYKASGLFQGNDEVRFVAIDDDGAFSQAATITINLFNTAPTARSTTMQVAAGGSADVGIFGADIDRDDLTFRRVGGPTKGSGEIRRDENGNFRFYYQNSPAAVGDDLVRFVALDGKSGGVSAEATITIKVIGVFNRAPSAASVSGTTSQGQSVAVAVSGTDPDEDDVLTFKRVGGPTKGTGEIRQDVDGIFKMFYTPRADFVGTETIRYVALDQKGRPSAPATITIRVTASAPAAIKNGPAPSSGSS